MTKYIQPRLTTTPAQEIAQLREQNAKLIAEIARLEIEKRAQTEKLEQWRLDYAQCSGERDMQRARGDELARLLTIARKWSAAWKLSYKGHRIRAEIHGNVARILRERNDAAAKRETVSERTG